MALKDSWHRTLVYFGLAEEYDADPDYDPDTGPEVALEDRYRERPNVRRLAPRRRADEIDDIFGAEQPRGGRQHTVLRSRSGRAREPRAQRRPRLPGSRRAPQVLQ